MTSSGAKRLAGTVAPGDVVVVRTPSLSWWDRWASFLIRFGAALRDEPNLCNHVAIVHHADPVTGDVWLIEARPGGVGWATLASYDNKYLVSNWAEMKTDEQRQAVCDAAVGMLGVRYDWNAILGDAEEALHLAALWRGWSSGGAPAHVVCSSLADWLYGKVGLAHPGNGRLTTPGDWYELFLTKGWA